jgi:hypothetical protein
MQRAHRDEIGECVRFDMSEMALWRPTTGIWRRIGGASHQMLLGIAEGFAAARRYERLALMSDAELARRGLAREDLAWFAVYGEHCPR